MTSGGSSDGSEAPPDLESLPPVVRAVLGELQQRLHAVADHIAAATEELTAETVRQAASTTPTLHESRLDLLTSVNLTAESLHAWARYDADRGRELQHAAERYLRQAADRDGGSGAAWRWG